MIPFSIDVYIRVIERYAATFWPMSVIAFILAALVIILCLRPGAAGNRFVSYYLAVVWIWVGAVYYGQFFTGLNWAAWISAGIFVIQGLLFAVFSNQIDLAGRSISGIAFLLFALFGYPALGVWAGLDISAVPMVGFNPEPTTLFTLGVLILSLHKIGWRLILLPVLAAFISGVTAWLMDWPHDTILLPAALLLIWQKLRLKSDNSLDKPKSAHGADA